MVEGSQFRQKQSRKWTRQEDNCLLNAVRHEYFGELPHSTAVSWIRIQRHIPWRSSLQIRERYMHVLDPHIRHGTLTKDELARLLRYCEAIGNKWVTISKYFPGRTSLALKNSYHSAKRTYRRLNGKRDPEPRELLQFFISESDVASRQRSNEAKSENQLSATEYIDTAIPSEELIPCSSTEDPPTVCSHHITDTNPNMGAVQDYGCKGQFQPNDGSKGKRKLEPAPRSSSTCSIQEDKEPRIFNSVDTTLLIESSTDNSVVKKRHTVAPQCPSVLASTLNDDPAADYTMPRVTETNELAESGFRSFQFTHDLMKREHNVLKKSKRLNKQHKCIVHIPSSASNEQSVSASVTANDLSSGNFGEMDSDVWDEDSINQLCGDQQIIPSTPEASSSLQNISGGFEWDVSELDFLDESRGVCCRLDQFLNHC